MTPPLPRGVTPFATSVGPGGLLGALWSAAWDPRRNAELSHGDYRSADDPAATHRVGATWPEPFALQTLRICFSEQYASYVPRAFRVLTRTEDHRWVEARPAGPAPAACVEVELGGARVTGVAVEQAPGGGSAQHPGVLRIGCLAVTVPIAARARLEVGLVRRRPDGDEEIEWPAMPFATDGDPDTVLDASDAQALVLRASPDLVALGVTVALVRELTAAGTPDVSVCFDAPRPLDGVRIPLPRLGPHVCAIRSVEPQAPPEPTAVAAGVPPVEAVSRPTFTASLAGRAAVGADGVVLAPLPGLHAGCLRLDLGLVPPIRRRLDVDGLGLTLQAGDRTLAVRVDPLAGSIQVRGPGAGSARLTAWESLRPLPVPEGVVLTCGARGEIRLEIPGSSAPAPPTPALLDLQLPGRWGGLVRRLAVQAGQFIGGDGRMTYGLFPSVYAGDVFGLEEDWAIRALAMWGDPELALTTLRRTLLTAEHLTEAHYLHDLRRGLAAWQAWTLLGLIGRGVDALDRQEQALLRSCAEWVVAERARAKAHDTPGALPGLLPPARYGGDVSFSTQSLTTNAVAARGLRAAADLFGDPGWAAEAAALREAVLAGLDAVWDPASGHQPLHSGGGAPGDYHQLLAAGILDPLDLFAPGDVRAARIDEGLERSGRLYRGLPRFDGWGAGECVDAHYALGWLLNALRAGRREVFWEGLNALVDDAMDPDAFCFREVSPIPACPLPPGPEVVVPGRRLSQSEPCVGGVGVALQLIRHAIVCELPEPDGRLGRRIRCLAGAPDGWWESGLHVVDAPTLAGPVTVRLAPGGPAQVYAPGAEAIELVGRDGAIRVLR